MGVYSYLDLTTGEEFDLTMTMDEMLVFEDTKKEQFRRILKPISTGDSVRLGVTKSPDSFNDLLKTISKRNRHSEMNYKNGEQ